MVKPHGLHGAVVVEVLTDVEERFQPGVVLQVRSSRGGCRKMRIASARAHRGRMLVELDGVGDRDAAEALRGCDLEVEGREVRPAPEGAFYHFELVDCVCRDRRHGELGRVVDVVEDGGGLLLIVSDGTRRLPIPFVAEFLDSVDVEGGTIAVDLPAGLLETCASK